MKTVGVFVKPTENLSEPLEHLVSVLRRAGCQVLLEERAAQALGNPDGGFPRPELGRRSDVAVVLGGDGTLLGVARQIADSHCPLIGVNAGRLGFIEGVVFRNGREIFRNVAVNDIGFSHGRAGGMVDFIIYVDGKQMSAQSADGVVCSTATGSTAYALAAGGPILHPSMDAVVLVPVAPHTLSNRPIVLPSSKRIEIELVNARDATAYFDMQEFCDVEPGDMLRIQRSERVMEILHPLSYDYYDLLRRKLKWNYSPTSVKHHEQISG